jgi:hypothetical protein
VKVFEIVAASIFALLGVRSAVHWIRRPIDSPSLRDHVLYSLWILGRAGLWFAVAGIFAISASIEHEGRAFSDEWSNFRWYILVPLVLAALQAITGYALGRPGEER